MHENSDESLPMDTSLAEDVADSDDDFDWEEVAVPVPVPAEAPHAPHDDDAEDGPSAAAAARPNIEVTIQARPKQDDAERKKRAAQQAARASRLNCHKAHTVLLLGNARCRNRWLNDPLLHARLMSLVPMHLQNGFAIHKSRVPEAAMRGRMFEAAMVRLADWWAAYFAVLPTGHIRSRTYEEVQRELAAKMEWRKDGMGKRRARDGDEDEDGEKDDGGEDEGDGEVVRSEKSLMKHALQRRGCRDTSAQLFTALCRALGIPARLVVSLQSVPWQANAGKPKSSAKKKADRKGKGRAAEDSDEEEDGAEMEMEEVDIPASPAVNGRAHGKDKGKGKEFPGTGQRLAGSSASPSPDKGKGKGKQKASPVISLRKSRGRKLGSAPAARPAKRERTPDPLRSAPVFWTEVFSRADARWLPVDAVRGLVNKRRAFDPSAPLNAPPHTRVENRMVYVLALEEDGYARDVTARYAREYGAKVSKLQQGGRGKKEWWERVMAMVRRPYRLNRDDVEDEELHVNQMTEQMPTTMTGFKNHPLYVLARHLRREEVIHPRVELGKFRGEPVYARSSVVSLKTAENWMRQGRRVREGCQPMKWVKQRAVTVNKRRAVEMALAAREDRGEGFSGEKDVMQGLYAENQTELYVPDPVVDGKVPKNDFGNIDLYVPSMLPAGGVHIPYKGAWKIARQLGFDYAEAVTGFEFKKRRALPVLTGIVVAAENEDALLEAYWAAEKDAEQARKAKRQENAIKRWQRLVQGLRIRQRLKEQYADRVPQRIEVTVEVEKDEQHAGGFLNTADVVVQPYTLPRNLHEVPSSPPAIPDTPPEENLDGSRADRSAHSGRAGRTAMTSETEPPRDLTLEEDEGDLLEEVPIPPATDGQDGGASSGVPKTMRELAEDAERRRVEALGRPANVDTNGDVSGEAQMPPPPPPADSTHAAAASTPGTRTRTPPPKAAPRLTPRRGRKRARAEDAVAGGGDRDAPPSRAKRARASRGAAPPPIVASDRVLRPRTAKSAARVREEREEEEAYRRAVADR